jgi:hypothetical protein
MGRKYQEGLVVAAEYNRMDTSMGIRTWRGTAEKASALRRLAIFAKEEEHVAGRSQSVQRLGYGSGFHILQVQDTFL